MTEGNNSVEENKFISAGNNTMQMIESYARRAENLMADTLRLSADWAELRKQFTGDGLDHFQAMKTSVKAKLLDAEDGGKRVHDLRVKNEMARVYLDVLAPEKKGDGE